MSNQRPRLLAPLTALMILVSVLVGCAAKSNRTLVYVEGTDVTPMDPAYVTDTPTWAVLHLLYNGLVKFKDEKTEIVPDLATEWQLSDDKQTWTFKLRKNVKFHDGTPFNAEAVKYNIERILDEKNASPYRATFAAVQGASVVDDYTVSIATRGPFPDLLLLLVQSSGGMVSPTAAKKYQNQKDFGKQPVGTGPFKLKEWLPGEKTVVDVNKDYFGEKPWLEQVIYKGVPEASTRVAMLKRGEADIIVKVPLEEMDGLNKTGNVKAISLPSMYTISFELLNDKPPLNDVRVRQALNYAVDKEAIVKNVLMGQGRVNDSPLPPGVDFRKSFQPYPYDPAKARQLLKEAGAEGFKLALWGPNGRYQKDRQATEAVGGYLKAVGINVDVKIWEWAPFLEATRGPERMAFMLGRATPGMDFTATRLYAKQSFDLYNLTRYTNPKVEELLVTGRSTFDPKVRERAYGEMQDVIWKDAPYLYLHNQVQTYGTGKTVSGMVALPHELVYLENVKK